MLRRHQDPTRRRADRPVRDVELRWKTRRLPASEDLPRGESSGLSEEGIYSDPRPPGGLRRSSQTKRKYGFNLFSTLFQRDATDRKAKGQQLRLKADPETASTSEAKALSVPPDLFPGFKEPILGSANTVRLPRPTVAALRGGFKSISSAQ